MPNQFRTLARTTLMFALMTVICTSTVEAAKQKDGTTNPVFAIPKEITLNADQQAKLDAIKKEWAPKVLDASEKMDAILTTEQKVARKDAIAKLKADGKSGKDLKAGIDEALKLTDEQKAKTKEVESLIAAQTKSIKEQIYAILTEEQKPSYKLPKEKKTKKSA